MSQITIYSKEGCAFCDRLSAFLKIKEVEFTKLDLNDDFTSDEFVTKFGQGATFPQVLYGDKHIGGARDSLRYLAEHNML